MQKAPLFSLFITLLLNGCAVQAQTRFEMLDSLQAWRQSTSERQDLFEREKDLRLQFISRLLFQSERNYTEGIEPRLFFEARLGDMTLTDRRQVNQSLGAMDVFLETLCNSMKELLEPKENPLEFIQAFSEFSGISDPASLEEFAETRSYSNGKSRQAAQPLDPGAVSELIEAREKTTQSQPDNLLKTDQEQNLNRDFTQDFDRLKDLMLQNSSNPNDESSRP